LPEVWHVRQNRRQARRQWCCRQAECAHVFSAKSGTKFDNSKLSYLKLLKFLVAFVNSPKGITLHDLASDVGVTEKTAHLNQMKVREAITKMADRSPLDGLVHIDGAHFCGKFRKSNHRRKATADDVLRRHGTGAIKKRLLDKPSSESRANRRRAKNRRVVIAMTQVFPASNPLLKYKTDDPRKGISRVIVATCYTENSEDVQKLVAKYLLPGTMVFTDENPAYIGLTGEYEHHTVNHSVEYSTAEGVSDNMAEAFFSRMRRAQYGVHHGMRPQYLEMYAWEKAWREMRRIHDQESNCKQLLEWLLSPGYSDWRGYHGGNKRRHTRKPRPEIVMGDQQRALAVAKREVRKFGRLEAVRSVPQLP